MLSAQAHDAYSTGHLQFYNDFTEMNQNQAVQIHTNFFKYVPICKLIHESKFVTLNLYKKICDSEFMERVHKTHSHKEIEFVHKLLTCRYKLWIGSTTRWPINT